MSELQTMLQDMVQRLFQELDGQQEPWPLIEEFGLTNLMLPEVLGGFEGKWRDALIVFELLGSHALPLPVGETLIARHYIQQVAPDQLEALNGRRIALGYNVAGKLTRFEQDCDILLVASVSDGQTQLSLIDAQQLVNAHSFADTPAQPLGTSPAGQPDLFSAGALLRAAQMSGAMASVLQMSVNYVNERSQFGRPIGKFQAIQHDLAKLAEQVAAVQCAVQAACLAADCDDAAFEIAAAKLRANLAVPLIYSVAHQVHGAIGFTREHSLHRFSQRLTAWRGEFGNDRYWSTILGKLAVATPNLWQFITARGDNVQETL